MPIKRTYAEQGDRCAAARAMDAVGDRWTIVVVRELLFGARRFNELFEACHGITPAVLTARLRELDASGIVRQRELDGPTVVVAYELTSWGKELEPIICALGRWAQSSPQQRGAGGLTPAGVALAMRTITAGRTMRGRGAVELRLHDRRSRSHREDTFAVTWSSSDLTIERGVHPDPRAVVQADSTVWATTIFDRVALTGSEQDHGLRVTGDRAMVTRLINAFTATGSVEAVRG